MQDKTMDINTEFLNYIYQNAEMGIEGIETILRHVEDPATIDLLKKQLDDYKAVNVLAFKKLKETGQEEKDITALQKVLPYLTINIKATINKSPAHIAEMMLQGGTMGIIDITRNLGKYNQAAAEIVQLGQMLLKLEEDCFNQWKKHLFDIMAQ